jgi:hypothetical protein
MSRLPSVDQRWIPDTKIREYCLGGSTVKSRSRLKFFTTFGFSQTEWRVLRDTLLHQVVTAKIEMARQDQYGTTYRAVGPIPTPSGRVAMVETFWIIRADEPRPQLTSVIPRGKLEV